MSLALHFLVKILMSNEHKLRFSNDGAHVYVHNADARSDPWMRQHGAIWLQDQDVWCFATFPFTVETFVDGYLSFLKKQNALFLKKQIVRPARVKKMKAYDSQRVLYEQRLRHVEENKARWLEGDVLWDEHALVNPYACPFSESGDHAAGIAVCFAGYRPALCAEQDADKIGIGTSGRYGYIIGKHDALMERMSNIRRRVGKLIHFSSVCVLTRVHSEDFEKGLLRSVVVFDVDLYGG